MKPHLIFVFLLFLFSGTVLFGQGGSLEAYVQEALQQSPALKEQVLLLERSQLAVQEAKGFYMPEVNANGTYSLAGGGRSISIPIGDLLNPVYSTLNQLTQTNSFPQVENAEEQFLPNNFYDVRVRATQPIYNPDIRFQHKIRSEQVTLQEDALAVRKRDLERDVKLAYFQFLQATEAVKIYDNALVLLQENYRLNEGLVRNGMAIPSTLIRIQGETSAVESQRTEALSRQTLAQAYFNFLLGRPYEEPVEVDPAFAGLPATEVSEEGYREELSQLETAGRINTLLIDQEKAFRQPRIGAQLDLGSQNFGFEWGGYAILGLSVNVPLWDGARHSKRLQQAEVGLLATEAQREWAARQIGMQTLQARQSLQTAVLVCQSYVPQIQAAQRYFNETQRRFRENQANFIEILDARTQLTNLEIQESISRYQAWIHWAELQRAIAPQ
ncbi:MAG: TolC family protein [Saprospirales bacterium]|nr:TolC family protein [Saprospirales bacterium]